MIKKTNSGKLIICCAPSGSGKSTLETHLLQTIPNLQFSVSATSRLPRGEEKDGVEYHFISEEELRQGITRGDFLESCEVYPGCFYGTLRSEVDNLLSAGHHVVCDVDVIGAENIKKIYGSRSLTLFIQPPSIDELRRRLEKRGTETPDAVEQRLARAAYELSFAPRFDAIITNDKLDDAKSHIEQCVRQFLNEDI